MNLKAPEYVAGHGLIKGKSVLITAAAGAGIGFRARRGQRKRVPGQLY